MFKKTAFVSLPALVVLAAAAFGKPSEDKGWISLFNGKNLDGWKVNENKETFKVRDGAIVANGHRSHLFYTGPVENADFKNFKFKADVMTLPGSNSGVYFHTEFQEHGWPAKGYEVQVNNTHGDPKKTGGLYAVKDVFKAPAKDNEWFELLITVRGYDIEVEVDGKKVVDWTQPWDYTPPRGMKGRLISHGTFALQGHDPGSTVKFKNIMVKPLERVWISLFDGKTLKGWKRINGKAKYKVEKGTIAGTTVKGSPNSFLCTEKHYSDFELRFEVKLDPRLNSGVQIRSNSFKHYRNGRVHGYQVEIATNGNAGFIYDEARRGWLSKDRSDPKKRSAFKKDKWNKYRVICKGDTIKTWVNGVPVAHVKDSMTKKGFIGLQVHSFGGEPPAQVRWRNIRLKKLK